MRNNRKAVVKTADHPVTPTQPSSITLRLTPAVCRERMEQLEAWTVCVSLCVWVCVWQRVHLRVPLECVRLRVHGPVRMHPCWWHKAQPQLDLTLIWMPLWRQSGFVWPHTSTEEDMEKICGPVSLRDYMAPLNSGLNNAPNPMVPFHCNYGFCL